MTSEPEIVVFGGGVSLNTLVVSLVSQGIGKSQVAKRVNRRVTTHAIRTRAKTTRVS